MKCSRVQVTHEPNDIWSGLADLWAVEEIGLRCGRDKCVLLEGNTLFGSSQIR